MKFIEAEKATKSKSTKLNKADAETQYWVQLNLEALKRKRQR